MSIPISTCLFIKAANGDEEAYQRLVRTLAVNLAHGAWTQLPCQHNPKCKPPPIAKQMALLKRLEKDIPNRPERH